MVKKRKGPSTQGKLIEILKNNTIKKNLKGHINTFQYISIHFNSIQFQNKNLLIIKEPMFLRKTRNIYYFHFPKKKILYHIIKK